MRKVNVIVGRILGIPTDAHTITNTSVEVKLSSGKIARLDPAVDSRAAVWAEILSAIHQEGLAAPVYLEIDEHSGAISEVLLPARMMVEYIGSETLGEKVEVGLSPSHTVHYINRSNPNFQHLYEALNTALFSGHEVFVTTKLDEPEIIDVRDPIGSSDTPDSENFTESSSSDECKVIMVSSTTRDQMFKLVNSEGCDCSVVSPCIPFIYPDDGCWARAHKMREDIMQHFDYDTCKVWVTGNLCVNTANNPNCYVRWGWHVAPIVFVPGWRRKPTTWVIDPSLFDKAVPYQTWFNKLGDAAACPFYTSGRVFNRTPGCQKTHVFYDNTYQETNQVLRHYRYKLKLRIAKFGCPPYSHCSPTTNYCRT